MKYSNPKRSIFLRKNKSLYLLITLSLSVLFSCNNKQSTSEIKVEANEPTQHTPKLDIPTINELEIAPKSAINQPVHTNEVIHNVTSDPVQILNIFPEQGLTDPHNIIVNGRLYLAMGHDKSWDIETDWTMDRWEIWSTDDLKKWRKETEILPNDTYFGPAPNCWAGDFAEKDGKYYWYFSNRNIDTGVMVADAPGGPYKDALGKPLLPAGLTSSPSYDPEIFEEEGVYNIVWGAGTYYIATLGEDMLSLSDKPEAIVIKNNNGEKVPTDDKPTLFKRNDNYYLVWGAHYAMSKNVRGPYEYKGSFMAGGHGSIFKWQEQWYVVHEHHDISMYYRGIMLKPLIFNEDGTVNLDNDEHFPAGGGRVWEFDRSSMGWRTASNGQMKWNPEGSIKGNLSGPTIIESANWASADPIGRTLKISLKNQSNVNKINISFALFKTDIPEFWKYADIDWTQEASIVLDIKPNSDKFETYSLPLDEVENLPVFLKRLRIEFLNAESGDWEIDSIYIQ